MSLCLRGSVSSCLGGDRGVALVVVLFLAAILTLMMYAFLREMQVEHALAASFVKEKQAEQLAWSAMERAAAVLSAEPSSVHSPQSAWYDNRDEWHETEVEDAAGNAIGVYSLVHEPPDGALAPLFGVSDEASRINLNTAPRSVLLRLPRMTPEIADAILDWRDADDAPREAGAESTYYLSLQPGYACKNGAFDTVEELLLVKGVTGEVLYGEDTNRNGVLDANENDGDATPPLDDADGALDRGLFSYVTVWSVDRNVRLEGTARVNINTATTAQLTQALGDQLSPAEVNAIVTRRPLVAAATGSPGYRSGADLMNVPGVGVPGIAPEQYRAIADRVTVVDGQTIPGLVNVNTAPRAILEMVPGWTGEDVAAVLAFRAQGGQDLETLGWLTQVLTPDKVQSGAPYLTTRAYQFRMDAVGRTGPRSTLELSTTVAEAADPDAPVAPARVFRRFVAVFDKAAAPARFVYWKDISRSGFPYPIEEAAP